MAITSASDWNIAVRFFLEVSPLLSFTIIGPILQSEADRRHVLLDFRGEDVHVLSVIAVVWGANDVIMSQITRSHKVMPTLNRKYKTRVRNNFYGIHQR
jgi:hypothetical protein